MLMTSRVSSELISRLEQQKFKSEKLRGVIHKIKEFELEKLKPKQKKEKQEEV